MALQFYNTMSRRQEAFEPREAGKAAMYTCGPTVYNYAHIGNFRAYIFEDILRRALRFCGYEVNQVMNLTDVDDKTIRDSIAAGMSLDAFTQQFKDAFFEDVDELRIERAEAYPAATDHISEMIDIITTLIEKNIAYVSDDNCVYYSIDKFPDYGKLAQIDRSGQRSGTRVKNDEYEKDSVADFALWKAWGETDGDTAWDSPWGRGRPGWHIECSAMSMKYLGPHFDLHTGGVDNMFPHHEDEIAQSEAATGETFVNYWLHCEHLMVNGKKMSKSEGNFFTLRDLLDAGYTGREVRYLLLAAHYRQQLNFRAPRNAETNVIEFVGLEEARTVLRRFDDFIHRLREVAASPDMGLDTATNLCATAESAFRAGLEDDLNISEALAAFFDFMRDVNKALDDSALAGNPAEMVLTACRRFDSVLDVFDLDKGEEEAPAEILALVEARQQARQTKDFARADEIRDELTNAGWVLEDSPTGPRVKRA